MSGKHLTYSARGKWRRRLRFPMAITLPGGRRHERHAYLFWRVRIPLWLVPAAAGWLVLGWPGIPAGLAAGILAELVFSYRAPYGPSRPVATPGQSWGPDGPAGMREPRRPHPTGGAEAAQLPTDPRPSGID